MTWVWIALGAVVLVAALLVIAAVIVSGERWY